MPVIPEADATSYGGGWQSTALLVLAATGRYRSPLFLFSNVGDDSEHPGTLDYVRDIAIPYGAEHGIEVVELHRTLRDGTHETLKERIERPELRSIPFPARMPNTGAPGNRSCTYDFKIRVVSKEAKRRGATPDAPWTIGIGISTDEHMRASNRRASDWEKPSYPLLELDLNRADCAKIIVDSGLPVPPKSSCYFCPFHTPQTWAEMRRDEPELFAEAVELERKVIAKRRGLPCPGSGDEPEALLGDQGICKRCEERVDLDGDVLADHMRGPVYLTRFGRPLDQAIPEAGPQLPLMWEDTPGAEGCDEGYCWT